MVPRWTAVSWYDTSSERDGYDFRMWLTMREIIQEAVFVGLSSEIAILRSSRAVFPSFMV